MDSSNQIDTTQQPIDIFQPTYAGFWLRYFAQLIDICIWSLNFFVPLYLLSTFGTANIQTFIPSFLWFLLYALVAGGLIKFFAHPWLISKIGGGLGKLVCGLEITNTDGSRLTFKNALFREVIAKIASNALLGYGYYAIFKDPHKQAWHDSLAGTYVVKKHNGFFVGLMVLVLFLAIIAGLSYKSYDNFKNAKTLQYDVMTTVTQIQQDFTNYQEESTKPKTPTDEIDTTYIESMPDYKNYENMTPEELLKEIEKYKTQ